MPHVTVIIPNFNHARYLSRRIESVLAQTYTDFDVILMDDASTDDSRSILQGYSTDARVRLLFNETNSGSTFKQWNKGVRAATGDFIWLAESDDYADPRFLERLVPLLDNNPNVGIAYRQSYVIDAEGAVLRTTHRQFLFAGEEGRWEHDFTENGKAVCANYLTRHNIIYNASAVLFRRSLFNQIGGADETMLINGDWKCWASMLLRSDLAHVAEPLNYFRTHPHNVRSTVKFARSILETVAVLDFIGGNLAIDPLRMRQHKAWIVDILINKWLWSSREEKKELRRAFNTICEFDRDFRRQTFGRILSRAVKVITSGEGWRWTAHILRGK